MESVAIVAVPFPAQGHLNQLLHLSLLLASRGMPVHYAAPPEHVRQARARVHGWGDDAIRCIRFHELPIQAYVSPPPNPAADSPFPSHLMPLFRRPLRQRFIWVLPDADRGNVFADHGGEDRHAKFLCDFTKQTQGKGHVITGWAPQLEILAHAATEAFMSHCGWNSTMESMSHGKPILAWPMHSDQPWDAELACKYLKVGILVRPCEKHSEATPAATIQELIEKMMVTDESRAMRQRAAALGEDIRAGTAVGGSSHRDLEAFIAHITRSSS